MVLSLPPVVGLEGDGVGSGSVHDPQEGFGKQTCLFLTARTDPIWGVSCSDQQQIEYSRDLFLPASERVERDQSTASSVINLASLFAQCSAFAGIACASAFDAEVPAVPGGSTSGAVADEHTESGWPRWVRRWRREKEASLSSSSLPAETS